MELSETPQNTGKWTKVAPLGTVDVHEKAYKSMEKERERGGGGGCEVISGR